MTRREFLKNVLTTAALAPIAKLEAKAGLDGDKTTDTQDGPQVTRRRYKDTNQSLPLLGFGMMRLPKINPEGNEIDYKTAGLMFDRAMKAGLNYFDTAYPYHGGLSEKCCGDLLTKYPRDSYYLTSKLPVGRLQTADDMERIFNEQLTRTKAGYFDFYLAHAMNGGLWEKFKQLKVFEFMKKKQAEGKIRRIGFSFHDTPKVLKTIAEAHPWDVAQIQLNYIDWTLQKASEQYEILTKLGIPVIVMEPLRGGVLAKLTPDACKVLTTADPNTSVASWAFRYVGSLPNVLCILSGMTYPEHLEDNLKTFSPFRALSDSEQKTIAAAKGVYDKSLAIPCTSCQYCQPCPVGIEIPRIFGLYNQYKINGNGWSFRNGYNAIPKEAQAHECIGCRSCVKKCPQHIDIPTKLQEIAAVIKNK